MAEQLLKIKKRIDSVNSTKKITSAMELVASSKLMKKKKQLDNIFNYAKMVENIIYSCVDEVDENIGFASLLKKNDSKKNLYVVITSSLGLCGGYNNNVIKYVIANLKDDDEIMLIGQKSLFKMQELKYKLHLENIDIFNDFNYNKVKLLASKLERLYIEQQYGHIYLIYTHFKNALSFVPQTYLLFPFKPEKEDENDNNQLVYPPIYCPSKKVVFELLVPRYVETMMFTKISEAFVSEEASRRNAMDLASDNADELNKQLSLVYNKARQASITNEINEIMSGRLHQEDD